jgi:hypothetical protein
MKVYHTEEILEPHHGEIAGFYSCAFFLLNSIMFYNYKYEKLPNINTKFLFGLYKNDVNEDILKHFFNIDTNIVDIKPNETAIFINPLITISSSHVKLFFDNNNVVNPPLGNSKYGIDFQFENYKNINFPSIKPYMDKYFRPSENVINKIIYLENKYKIDYNNTCAVYFRGNDKRTETTTPTYKEILDKMKELSNESTIFLIQTDEYDFLEEISKNIKNFINFEETYKIRRTEQCGIHFMTNYDKLEQILYLNAAMEIVSKCKSIICTSSNVSAWSVIKRGTAEGVYQYFKPLNYDITRKNFWLE